MKFLHARRKINLGIHTHMKEDKSVDRVWLLWQQIVPSNLEVWAGYTSCELLEQRLHDLSKLVRLDHIRDLLQFIQEHHLSKHDT